MGRVLELLRPRTPTHWAAAIGAVLSLFSFILTRLLAEGLPFAFAVLPALLIVQLVLIVALVEHVFPDAKLGKKILYGLGLAGTFLLAFLVCAYWSFPAERVKDFVIQEVERPAGPGGGRRASGRELEIVDLSPSWLTGVHATGIRFTQRPESEEDAPVSILVDEARVRVSLLSLLGGGLGLSYDATLGGGKVDGEYESDDTSERFAVEIEDVNLLMLGALRAAVGLPLRGKLAGTVDLTVAAEAADTAGSIDLTVEGLKIGDGRAKLAIPGMGDGLTIEQIDAGTLRLVATAQEGVAEIQTFEARGPDVELSASGSVRLARPLSASRIDLLLRVKFSDAYRDRNDRTRGLFALLEVNPQLRAARTADGALQYRINGSPGGRFGTTPAGRAPAPAAPGRRD